MNISGNKKQKGFLIGLLFLILTACGLLPGMPANALGAPPQPAPDSTPVALHGRLKVEPFQLYGMSTHGIAWFPQYVNQDAFCTLRDDWNTN